MKGLMDKMSKFRSLVRNEKGGVGNLYVLLFSILIFCIFMLLSVSVYQIYVKRDVIQTAANEVLQVMKVENGADSTTRSKFDDLLRKQGMDPSKVKFTATPKLVQRGDVLEIQASVDHNIFGLKAVGIDYTMKIKVHISGLAHKFIR